MADPLLTRLDLRHHDGAPAINVWTEDGTRHIYPLTPAEACALVKRLAGFIQHLHQPDHDRTEESHAAIREDGYDLHTD